MSWNEEIDKFSKDLVIQLWLRAMEEFIEKDIIKKGETLDNTD